jgi:hypothetical protein
VAGKQKSRWSVTWIESFQNAFQHRDMKEKLNKVLRA